MERLILTILVIALIPFMLFGIDHLIIAPTEFIPKSNELAQYYLEHFGIERTVVDLQTIFNQYSDGNPDKTAIKQFISDTFIGLSNWEENSILLVGSGTLSWDDDKNKIVTYDTNGDYGYADLDTDYVADIPLGRLPAQNILQLNLMIDHIISYYENNNFGLWRDKVLFLADDEHKNGGIEGVGEHNSFNHTKIAEDTGNLINDNVIVKKVLGIEYTPDENGDKPEATANLINALNDGVLCWHYIGHGGTNNLGDERYFNSDRDIPLLANNDKIFLFTAATSNVGYFYDVDIDCLAERILFLENGGAIASIAAVAGTYPSMNTVFFNEFYSKLINEKKNLGIAFLDAENTINGHRYNILGDPLLKLNLPDSENSITIENTTDILYPNDNVNLLCNIGNNIISGTSKVNVYESEYNIHYSNTWNGMTYQVDYTKVGNSIYDNDIEIENGSMQTSFVVPQEVNFGDKGKIIIYSSNEDTDFINYAYPVIFNGVASDDDIVETPTNFELYQNYPNPFNPTTTIKFSIKNDSTVKLVLYNVKGQNVKTLASNNFTKGSYSIIWNGDNDTGKSVNSGMYFYKLIVNDKSGAAKKCLLLK